MIGYPHCSALGVLFLDLWFALCAQYTNANELDSVSDVLSRRLPLSNTDTSPRSCCHIASCSS